MYLLRAIASLFLLAIALTAQAQPVAHQGIIDLTGWDFVQAGSIKLDGEWKAATNQQIEPGAAFPDTFLPVPAIWGSIGLPDHGYASYQLKILLPDNAPALKLRSPTQYTAWKMWANGELIGQVGQPGSRYEETTPKLQERLMSLPKASTLELVWQVSNFEFYAGGPKRSLTLGAAKQMQQQYTWQKDFMLLNLGGYLILGLYFLSLYLIHPNEKHLLTLAWASALMVGRVFIGHKIEGNWLVDNFDYYIVDIVEWTTTWLFPPAYLLILHQIFKGFFNRYAVWSLMGIAVVYSLLSFSSQLNSSFVFINIGLVLFPIPLFYGLWGLVKAYQSKARGSLYLLAVSSILIFSAMHDEYRAITGEYYPHLTPYTLFLWFIVSALTAGDNSQQRLKQQTSLSRQLDNLLLEKNIQLENQLSEIEQVKERLAKENSARSNFLSILSHELRTPLNGLKAISQALQHTQLDPQQQQLVSSAKSTSSMITLLIDQLLDQSQVINNQIVFKKSSFSVAKLLEDTICLMHYQADLKGQTLDLQLVNLPDYVQGDRDRLQLVFISCINYWIKHSGQCRMNIVARGNRIAKDQWNIHVSIRSNKIERSRQQVLQDFKLQPQSFSDQDNYYLSTGLGLSISQNIILAMQGEIHVRNYGPESGSLDLQLKLAEGSQDPSVALTARQPAKIMVIDDDPLNHQVIKILLPCDQYQVDCVSSGEEALQILDESYLLLLVDIQMAPMTGIELAEIIRALPEEPLAKIPMYAYTASLMPKQLQQFDQLFDGVLRKPVSQASLFNILNQQQQPKAAHAPVENPALT